MNLEEMAFVMYWSLGQDCNGYYDIGNLERYDPLVVPVGTSWGDVRDLVRHVHGENVEFEIYGRAAFDSGSTFQCRSVSLPADSPSKTLVISDPAGMRPPICWLASGDVDSLVADAKRMYPGRKVEFSQIVRVEPTEREFRYFVLK